MHPSISRDLLHSRMVRKQSVWRSSSREHGSEWSRRRSSRTATEHAKTRMPSRIDRKQTVRRLPSKEHSTVWRSPSKQHACESCRERRACKSRGRQAAESSRERREHGGDSSSEHGSTSTENAETRTPSSSVVLQSNAESLHAMCAAQVDRADTSVNYLALQLDKFLCHVLQGALDIAEIPEDQISDINCVDIVFETLQSYYCDHIYKPSGLLLHKKMYDVMTRDKDGLPKEFSFTIWCKRLATYKKNSTATEHAELYSTATEHGECNNPYYRALAEDILTNELTDAQKRDRKYKFHRGKALNTTQRSLINVILRKHLGDARVTFFLFNHPIPTLLDLSVQTEAPTKALLQNMLEEFMTWHASFLQSLVARQQHPDMIHWQMISNLDQTEWQRQRRQRKREAQQRLKSGALLVEERNSCKRTFADMSPSEQQTIHDFGTQKTIKMYEQACTIKPPHFSGELL